LTQIIELETVGSTNDHARNLARSGAAHGTVVWAHEQTAGRGRQGNQWVSPRGNLYMSVILRPDNKTAAENGQLSFVAAVALAETMNELAPQAAEITLKWPNDVLLNNRKAAGILLETETDGATSAGWVIVGMGVNVQHAPENAICLQQVGVDVTLADVMQRLRVKLQEVYDVWNQKGFDPVRAEWLRHAHKPGQVINVRLPNETFQGKFLGIDATGALQVETENGTRRDIASGEVFAA
jgi:BirA family biotin operon repressor/biotin-[acetyl-CoA-carboxylase] ligase